MTQYSDFLESKLKRADATGFECDDFPPGLFQWQADVVQWACRQGRAALFADTGLGKTAMQLAWAEAVCGLERGPVLILTPLAVARQTESEARKFGIGVPVRVIRDNSESGPGINICNYERLHRLDPSRYAGIVLDESSILKAYMGKTKRTLIESFRDTPYRLCCTATPAPNDHLELGNHAEFLGVMPSNEMISRWFVNDTMQAGGYRLRGHGAEDFWRWVSSWAVCISSPADLGYDDSAFTLPPLQHHLHMLDSDACPPPAGFMFHTGSVSTTGVHNVKRATAAERAAKAAELVSAKAGPWLVWCDTDYEADALLEAIPDAVDVRGSQPLETKEERLAAFSAGQIGCLVTKPTVAGYGLNWQHCHQMVFAGASFSFEQSYQAVRRCWRFGQKSPVDVHVISTDAEAGILEVLAHKQELFQQMRDGMVAAVRETQLENLYGHRKLRRPPAVTKHEGQDWTLYHGDCVESVKGIESESVGFTIFSPPFANLYIYSDSIADMGNCASESEFFQHFRYLLPELYRVTIPGRLCAIHCKDLPLYFGRDGATGLKDFPGEITREMEAAGWTFHSRVTIWKCPVTERERTNNNGLLHKTATRDRSQLRQGMADYLLVFRRVPSDSLMSSVPVVSHDGKGFSEYIGTTDPSATEEHPSPYARKKPAAGPNGRSIDIWRRYAEPVWWDIDQTNVLNYQMARDAEDERHICPLQLDVIERAIQLWSNPGDLVLTPFAGIGSEMYGAILLGRRAVGCELKDSYVRVAKRHLDLALTKRSERERTLFS
jgi:DNA modification methylase